MEWWADQSVKCQLFSPLPLPSNRCFPAECRAHIHHEHTGVRTFTNSMHDFRSCVPCSVEFDHGTDWYDMRHMGYYDTN